MVTSFSCRERMAASSSQEMAVFTLVSSVAVSLMNSCSSSWSSISPVVATTSPLPLFFRSRFLSDLRTAFISGCVRRPRAVISYCRSMSSLVYSSTQCAASLSQPARPASCR